MSAAILRTILVYGAFLLLFRLLGKREMGQFSPFDLVVLLVLGEVSDQMIFGEIPLATGLAVIATIAALEWLLTAFKLRSKRIARILEGSPTELVREGRILEPALAREHLSHDDLLTLLRLEGRSERDLDGVESAVLEINGQLSVVEKPGQRLLRRRDVPPSAWP